MVVSIAGLEGAGNVPLTVFILQTTVGIVCMLDFGFNFYLHIACVLMTLLFEIVILFVNVQLSLHARSPMSFYTFSLHRFMTLSL